MEGVATFSRRYSDSHIDRRRGIAGSVDPKSRLEDRFSPRYSPYVTLRPKELTSRVQSIIEQVNSCSNPQEKITIIENSLELIHQAQNKIKLLAILIQIYLDLAETGEPSNKPRLLELAAKNYKRSGDLVNDADYYIKAAKLYTQIGEQTSQPFYFLKSVNCYELVINLEKNLRTKLILFKIMIFLIKEAIKNSVTTETKSELTAKLLNSYKLMAELLFQIALQTSSAKEKENLMLHIIKILNKGFNLSEKKFSDHDTFYGQIITYCLKLSDITTSREIKQKMYSMAITFLFQLTIAANNELKIFYLNQINDLLKKLAIISDSFLYAKIKAITNLLNITCIKLNSSSYTSRLDEEIDILFNRLEKKLIDLTAIINMPISTEVAVPSIATLDSDTQMVNLLLLKIPYIENYFKTVEITKELILEFFGYTCSGLMALSQENLQSKIDILFESLKKLDTYYKNTFAGKWYFETKIILFNAIRLLETMSNHTLLPPFSEISSLFNVSYSKPIWIFRDGKISKKQILSVFDKVYCFTNYNTDEPTALGSGTYGRVRVMINSTSLHEDTSVVKKVKIESWQDFFNFYQEYRTSRDIISPYVLAYEDFGLYEGKNHNAFFIMPRCKKLKLSEITDQKERFSILHKIAESIKAFHDFGLVYNDCKKINLLIDPFSGEVRLTDFGLVLPRDKLLLPEDYVFGGTYYPPERIRLEYITKKIPDDYDFIVGDIWTIGILALTFLGYNCNKSIDRDKKHREETGPNINGIFVWHAETMTYIHDEIEPRDPNLAAFLRGCLALDYHDRWNIEQVLASPVFTSI